jgi:hypothetical protein
VPQNLSGCAGAEWIPRSDIGDTIREDPCEFAGGISNKRRWHYAWNRAAVASAVDGEIAHVDG